MSLINGIRVEVKKIFDAGSTYIHKVEQFSDKITYELSPGEPFKNAYNEGERLAVLLDAEFVVERKIVRKSLTGEYFEKENKSV